MYNKADTYNDFKSLLYSGVEAENINHNVVKNSLNC